MLTWKNAFRIALAVACVAGAVFFFRRFPWTDTAAAIERANPTILGAALVVNLASLLAKGWAWWLLLPPRTASWRAAQESNLLGSAMNSVSVTVAGETARVQDLATRERVSVATVAASVVRVRGVEALALACFMLLAPSLLHLPPILRGLRVAGIGLVLALAAATWSGRRSSILSRVPARARRFVASLTETGPMSTFLPALLFGILNWAALWATYDLTLDAFGIRSSIAASFTALVVTNLSGLFRLSPGNVGLTQAAMVVALLPFGVEPQDALAAGIALQAIQNLPVLALAALTLGVRQVAALWARERA